jgi:hypothetical protein
MSAPSISVSPARVTHGENLYLNGVGFTPGGKVNLAIDGLATGGTNANSAGVSNSVLFVGKNVPVGTQPVWMQDVATGENSNVIYVNVAAEDIEPAPTPTPTPTTPKIQATATTGGLWNIIKPYAPYIVLVVGLIIIAVILRRK